MLRFGNPGRAAFQWQGQSWVAVTDSMCLMLYGKSWNPLLRRWHFHRVGRWLSIPQLSTAPLQSHPCPRLQPPPLMLTSKLESSAHTYLSLHQWNSKWVCAPGPVHDEIWKEIERELVETFSRNQACRSVDFFPLVRLLACLRVCIIRFPWKLGMVQAATRRGCYQYTMDWKLK